MSVSLIDGHIDDDVMTFEELIEDLEKVRYHLVTPMRKAVIDNAIETLKSQKAEIERLEDLNKCYYSSCQQIAKSNSEIKAEATKEFSDRLQNRCNNQGGCLYASDIGAELNEMEGEC